MNNTGEHNIGAQVAYWRRKRGKNQRALAGLAGISQSYLSLIETGRRPIDSRSTLGSLANALEVSVADLLGEPGDPTDPSKAAAAAYVPAIREALIRRDVGERGIPDPTLPQLIRSGGAYDFAGAAPLLPNLILGLEGADYIQASYYLGYILKHLGHHDLAREAARMAAAEARQLGDPAWIGIGEYLRVHTMPMEMPAVPAQLARRIAEEIQPHSGDPRVRQAYGMLHLYAALRAGIDQDRDLALDHLKEARQAADSLGEPVDLGFAKFAFGPTNVAFWTVGVMLELKEPQLAIEAARKADPTVIPIANRQAPFHADVAVALAQAGRDHEAIAAFARSEAIGPQWFRLRPTVRDSVGAIVRRTRRNAVTRPMRHIAVAAGLSDLVKG